MMSTRKISRVLLSLLILGVLVMGMTGCNSDKIVYNEAIAAGVDTSLFVRSEKEFNYGETDFGKRSLSLIDKVRSVYEMPVDSKSFPWRNHSNENSNSFLWGFGALQSMAVATLRANPGDEKITDLVNQTMSDLEFYASKINTSVYLDEVFYKKDLPGNRICNELVDLNKQVLEIQFTDSGDGYTETKIYGSSLNGVDPYYDDNIWCVIALTEAGELLGNKSYIEKAEQTMRYCLSGWTSQVGGGIKWKDTHHTKNACINGPAVMACTMFYDYYDSDAYTGADKESKKAFYLAWAEMIYEWSMEYFRDPADGLFYDAIQMSGDNWAATDKMKLTYNTGTFLSSAVRLYRITGKEIYRTHADETQTNAYLHFITRDSVNMPGIDIWSDQLSWFNVYLARGFADYGKQFGNDSYMLKLRDTMDYAWKNARDYYGLIKNDWSGRTDTPAQNYHKIEMLAPMGGMEVMSIVDVYFNH